METKNGPIVSDRAKAVFLVLFSLILAGFGIEESLNEGERAAIQEIIPATSNMVTSPVIEEMIQEEANEDGKLPDEADKDAKQTPEKALEAAGSQVESKGTADEPLTAVSTGVLDEYENAVSIPKIGAVLPIVKSTSFDTTQLKSDLDSGVVLYPASMPFGESGQTVLLGHSAPSNWPDIKHDTAFSRINELVAGDEIVVYYGEKVYQYEVTRSEIIKKGGDLSGTPPAGNSLVLVSCWPPGRDLNRIAVEAVLVGSD